MTEIPPLARVDGTVMIHHPGLGMKMWMGSVAFMGIELSAQTERELRTQLKGCTNEIEVKKQQVVIYTDLAPSEDEVRTLLKQVLAGVESVLDVAVACNEVNTKEPPERTTELPIDKALEAIAGEQRVFYETPPPPEPTRLDIFRRVWARRLHSVLAWCRGRAEYAAPCIFAPGDDTDGSH